MQAVLQPAVPPEPTVRFRPLSPDDFAQLLEWLQRPHVKQWWDNGDDTLDRVAAHYSRDRQTTKRFIAVIDSEDAGYFQYYRLEPGHVGIDQFLADGNSLSKGIGTRCVLAFVKMISAVETLKKMSVDPHPANSRAIACYGRCGFVHDPSRSSAITHMMTKQCGEPERHHFRRRVF